MIRTKISFFIISILFMVFFIPVSISAVSEENSSDISLDISNQVKYQYVDSVTTTISVNDGIASARAQIRDVDGDSTKLSCTLYLQKYSNGAWGNIQHWSSSTQNNTLSMLRTHSINKGKYRTKAVVKAYKGSKYETIIKYSIVKTY